MNCGADELHRSRHSTCHWRKHEALARQTRPASGPSAEKVNIRRYVNFPLLNDYYQGRKKLLSSCYRTVVQLPRRLGLFLSSTVRGIGSYARARPIAFAILLVEFVVSMVFLTFAAHQIYLRLVAKGVLKVAAGCTLSARPVEVALSAFLRHVDAGVVQEAVLSATRVHYTADVASLAGLPDTVPRGIAAGAAAAVASGMGGTQRLVANILPMPGLIDRLSAAGIPFRVAGANAVSQLGPRLFLVAYLGMLFMFARRMFGDGGGKGVGKESGRVRATFADVAGLAEAKASVMEVVSMLRAPERYRAVGARMPAGLLLVGPPGGGKTLLARCLAGEAGVPFYSCSGSDFVEVFAGRGASRVRELFARAAASAPCVVFIDELDALGKKRSMRISSSNEDDQTLNQLLAAMDGFDTSNNGVVVVGATNRYNLLDDALVRPGRFDRIVRVELPNGPDREAILKVHLRHKAVDSSFSATQLRKLAEMTPNFSGAALAALVNEAAIGAVRRNAKALAYEDLELAIAQYKQSRGGFNFGDLF